MTVFTVHHTILKSAMVLLMPALANGPKSRFWLAHALSETLEENLSMTFKASGVANNLWYSLTYTLIAPIPDSIIAGPSAFMSLSPCLSFCYDSHIGIGPTLLHYRFSSVAQSCLTPFDPMDYSMLGFPVHHQLPELAQAHVHWVSDAIQSSHPLSSPSLPSLNLSQHQGLFKWVSSSHQVAKDWSFHFSISPSNIQDWFPLGLTGWISLQSKGLSRVFSNTTVQKHQFFSAQLSLWSNSHIHTWPMEKP